MKPNSYFEIDIWDQIELNLEEIDETCVDIGYYEEDTHKDSGLAMSDLATIHERGSEKNNIPARPFMSRSGDMLYSDKNIQGVLANAIIMKIKPEAAYSQIGVIGQKSIQSAIDTQSFIALKPETIARKGHATILIDSKQLYNEPKYKVNKNPNEEEG